MNPKLKLSHLKNKRDGFASAIQNDLKFFREKSKLSEGIQVPYILLDIAHSVFSNHKPSIVPSLDKSNHFLQDFLVVSFSSQLLKLSLFENHVRIVFEVED